MYKIDLSRVSRGQNVKTFFLKKIEKTIVISFFSAQKEANSKL